MSATATVTKEWSDGKVLHSVGTIALSGNYAGPDTLDLRVCTSGVSPFLVDIRSTGILKGIYNPGSGIDTGTISLFSSGGIYASQTLTSDATNVADGDTVTIDSTVYRFKTVMLTAYDIQIGSTAALSLANLKLAINANGTIGLNYFTGTVIHPTVIATTLTSTTLFAVAKVTGTGANSIATTETSSHLSWGNTTLLGGLAPTNNVGEIPTAAFNAALISAVSLSFHARFEQLL